MKRSSKEDKSLYGPINFNIHIYIYIYTYIYIWSYASPRAQFNVTTSHSICCGCCVRDYHISF